MDGTSTSNPSSQSSDALPVALSAYLSAKVGKPVVIAGLARISDGWESDVFAFDIPESAFPEFASGPRVLRMYYGANSGSSSLQEFRALELLARAGYAVPTVDFVEPSSDALGRSFLVMERIDGVSMGRRWRDADADGFAREVQRFCAIFAQLHTLEWQQLPGVDYVPQFTITKQFDLWRTVGQLYSVDAIFRALAWLNRTMPTITPQPLGLVHWDFHHENILVDREDRLWVIDWTQFQVTDTRFDLAWTLVLLESERDAKTSQAVREGYVAARGWNLADVEDELNFFEAAACAKRLVSVLISLSNGADSLGMRPGAEAIMSGRLARIAIVYRRWLTITNTPLPDVEAMLKGHL